MSDAVIDTLINHIKIADSTGISRRIDGNYVVFFAGSSRVVTDLEIIEAKKLKINDEINTLTGEKIAAMFGEEPNSNDLIFTQLNGLKRVAELKDKTEPLTTEELAELDILRFLGAKVQDFRDYGKQLKASVNASNDPESIDITIGWPE